MKRILSLLFAVMIAACACLPTAINSFAEQTVDPTKDSSLTVTYKYGETYYSDLDIKIYRIAEVDASLSFTLAGDFKNYPVNIYDVASQAEWKNISETLASYAIADQIPPTATKATDSAGVAAFTGLLPGMYLTLEVTHENEGKVTIFENFLTVIPRPNETGSYDYHVNAYPKCTQYQPSEKEIEYKVVKQWRDNGYSENRTQAVTIDIYNGDAVAQTVTLSDQNDWMYVWKAVDDGSVWKVVERDIPKDYSVNVTEEGTTFIVTNTYDKEQPPPSTGDSTNIYLYVLLLSISGVAIILLSVRKKKVE